MENSMSEVTQKPIYERTCVQWENKIVGFEELTKNEWAEIENFSNEIPGVIGLTLEELQAQQFTSSNPVNIPAIFIPATPEPINPIPIEEIGWLFPIVAILLFFFTTRVRKF